MGTSLCIERTLRRRAESVRGDFGSHELSGEVPPHRVGDEIAPGQARVERYLVYELLRVQPLHDVAVDRLHDAHAAFEDARHADAFDLSLAYPRARVLLQRHHRGPLARVRHLRVGVLAAVRHARIRVVPLDLVLPVSGEVDASGVYARHRSVGFDFFELASAGLERVSARDVEERPRVAAGRRASEHDVVMWAEELPALENLRRLVQEHRGLAVVPGHLRARRELAAAAAAAAAAARGSFRKPAAAAAAFPGRASRDLRRRARRAPERAQERRPVLHRGRLPAFRAQPKQSRGFRVVEKLAIRLRIDRGLERRARQVRLQHAHVRWVDERALRSALEELTRVREVETVERSLRGDDDGERTPAAAAGSPRLLPHRGRRLRHPDVHGRRGRAHERGDFPGREPVLEIATFLHGVTGAVGVNEQREVLPSRLHEQLPGVAADGLRERPRGDEREAPDVVLHERSDHLRGFRVRAPSLRGLLVAAVVFCRGVIRPRTSRTTAGAAGGGGGALAAALAAARELRRLPQDHRLLPARRPGHGNARRIFRRQREHVLSRVRDRRRRADEAHVVVAAYSTQTNHAPDDVGEVRPRDAAMHVRFVDHHVREVRPERFAPLARVPGQDEMMQRVRVGEHELRVVPSFKATSGRG
eukprot:25973-Pelagococcus_subviridis.AAC.6